MTEPDLRMSPREPEHARLPQLGASVHVTRGDESAPVRVLLVTDVRLLRDGLAQALGDSGAARVVATAGSGDEAVDALRTAAPAVALVDMSGADGLSIVRVLRAMAPELGIVAFAANGSEAEQLGCVEEGIAGFVSRDAGVDDLVAAIERVARGEAVWSPRVVATLVRRLATLTATDRAGATTPLSAREREIVALIDAGLSNKEIGHRLCIGVPTVKNHVHHILEKLHVSRRGEAAAMLRAGAPVRLPRGAGLSSGYRAQTSMP